jgi:hypothetical protein
LSNVGEGNGRDEMASVGRGLFGNDRDQDPLNLFSHDNFINTKFEKVIMSPLRRTQDTAMQIFGKIAAAKDIPFEVNAWAHEQRKSNSDVGLDKSDLVKYASCLAQEFNLNMSQNPATSLGTTLLNDMTFEGEPFPEDWATNHQVPSETLPYYPAGNNKEKQCDMCGRMQKLRDSLWAQTTFASFVVCHSAVIRHQFQEEFIRGRKPENGVMIYGRLQKMRLPDGTFRYEWKDVRLLQDALKPWLDSHRAVTVIMPQKSWLGKRKEAGDVDSKALCGQRLFPKLQKARVGTENSRIKTRDIVLWLDDPYPYLDYNKKGENQGRFQLKRLPQGYDIMVGSKVDFYPCQDWFEHHHDQWGDAKYAKIAGVKIDNHGKITIDDTYLVISYEKDQGDTWRRLLDTLCPKPEPTDKVEDLFRQATSEMPKEEMEQLKQRKRA